jgi:branched-chain amino acid transport system substrate-binding protein
MLALILALLIGIPAHPVAQAAPVDVPVGALLSLTGDWSTLGVASKAALEIAVDEVNRELSWTGSPSRVRLVVEDTRLNPATALEKIQSMAAQGVRVVIGPQSSAEVLAIKPFADANGIIVISQGSTAGSLSLRSDNILRFVPDDSSEGEAMAALLMADGIKAIVPIWRDDAGNEGLYVATKRYFESAGGVVIPGMSYATNETDYTATVATVGARLREAIAEYGASSVGIYLAAFDEAGAIFARAGADSVLASTRWYGSDGVALSDVLLNNSTAADFAMRTGYPNPTLGLDERLKDRWGPLSDKIKAKTGAAPDAFGLAAYDAFWVATRAYFATDGTTDASRLRDTIIQIAATNQGVTGATTLNDAGDRVSGSYDFWAIRPAAGKNAWTRVALYSPATSGGPGRLVRQ